MDSILFYLLPLALIAFSVFLYLKSRKNDSVGQREKEGQQSPTNTENKEEISTMGNKPTQGTAPSNQRNVIKKVEIPPEQDIKVRCLNCSDMIPLSKSADHSMNCKVIYKEEDSKPQDEQQEKSENERLEKEKQEKERQEKEREEKEKQEKERLEKEKQEKEKQEKERQEKERKEREEKEKQEKERLEKEKQEKQEKERLEKERLEKEKQEKERLEKEKQEKEKLEKERKEREEKEKQETERLEKEKQEKQEKERLEKERLEKEKQEKERLEKERQEKLEKERKEREEKEKEEKERLEKEKQEKERLEKEKQEKEKQEKQRKEREEKEKQEKERLEKEKQEKERLEKERKEREEKEKQEKERLEKERQEKEKLEKERLEKEKQEKEKQEKERQEKERIEKEREEKEKQEKERLEKERQEKEREEEEEVVEESSNRVHHSKQSEESLEQLNTTEDEKTQTEEDVQIMFCQDCNEYGEGSFCGNCGNKMIPKEELNNMSPLNNSELNNSELDISALDASNVSLDQFNEDEDELLEENESFKSGKRLDDQLDELIREREVEDELEEEMKQLRGDRDDHSHKSFNESSEFNDSHLLDNDDELLDAIGEGDEDVEDEEPQVVFVCMNCGEEGTKEECIINNCEAGTIEIKKKKQEAPTSGNISNLSLEEISSFDESHEIKKQERNSLIDKYTSKPQQNRYVAPKKQQTEEVLEEIKVDESDIFIIDLGTDFVRYGWTSNKEPFLLKNERQNSNNLSLPNLVANRPINSSNFNFVSANQQFFDDFFRSIFKLGQYTPEHPLVLLSSVPLFQPAPKDLANKIFDNEYAFIPSKMYFGYSPQFASFGLKNDLHQVTGIIVDSGASITTVVPVYFGSIIQHAIQVMNVGGDDINEMFLILRETKAKKSNTTKKSFNLPKKILKAIHEHCFLSSNFEQELSENGYFQNSSSPNQVIPGYEKKKPELEKKISFEDIHIGVEAFVSPEVFFRPELLQKSNYSKALDDVILDCIRSTPSHLHSIFLQNIFLVGENTKFTGLKERIESQIHNKVPQFPVSVHQEFKAKNLAWQGAKLLTKSENFLDLCVDSNEFALIDFNHKFF